MQYSATIICKSRKRSGTIPLWIFKASSEMERPSELSEGELVTAMFVPSPKPRRLLPSFAPQNPPSSERKAFNTFRSGAPAQDIPPF